MSDVIFIKTIYLMIHTVHLRDEYMDTQEAGHYKSKRIRFENLSCDDAMPEGYISSEEFRKRSFEKVNKFCDQHGIL